MEQNSAAKLGSVTPIAVARVRRERTQSLVVRLISEGIQPIELAKGDSLTSQGDRVSTGRAFLVVEGELQELILFDSRSSRLTHLAEYGMGTIAFLQGLFEGGSETTAPTYLIAQEPTVVYPIDLNFTKTIPVAVKILRHLYGMTRKALSTISSFCSESEPARLVAEYRFEVDYLERQLAHERARTAAAERSLADLTAELARKDQYVKALESGIEVYTKENDELRDSLRSLKLFREQQREVLISEHPLQDAVDDDEDEPDTGITDALPHGPAKPEPPPAADIVVESADADEADAPPDIEIIGIELTGAEVGEPPVEMLDEADIQELPDTEVERWAEEEPPADSRDENRTTMGYDGSISPFTGGQPTARPPVHRGISTIAGIPEAGNLPLYPNRPRRPAVIVTTKGPTGPKR